MEKLTAKRVSFEGNASNRLSGVFQPSAAGEAGAVVMAHCFTCSKDYKILGWLGRTLAEKGYGVLRFDFSGLGDSEGDFADTTFSTDIVDLEAAVGWLEGEGYAVQGLLGHSLGGAVAIETAARLDHVNSVIILGTSHDPSRLSRLLNERDWEALEEKGVVEKSIGGQAYRLTKEFLKDLEKHSLLGTVKGWKKSLLIFHGTEDKLVEVGSAQRIFAEAREPKAFFSVPGAGHLFMRERSHADFMAAVIDEWLRVNGG